MARPKPPVIQRTATPDTNRYRMAHVNRRSHRITALSESDSLHRIETLIRKHKGMYNPSEYITVVAEDSFIGYQIPGMANQGPRKGCTY